MGGAVGADQAGAVDGEAHRQLLDGDVVHHLVVAALQEGRVDRRERLEALGGEAGGEGDAVLLGDADIEAAFGKALGELVEAGARRHGRGDGDDLLVGLGLGDQRLGEHGLVGRRVGHRLGLLAGDDVELHDAVVLVGARLGRRIALALLGHDMDQDRLVEPAVARVLQHRQQMVEIVPVDRADIVEAQLVEQACRRPRSRGRIPRRAWPRARAAWAAPRRRCGRDCAR